MKPIAEYVDLLAEKAYQVEGVTRDQLFSQDRTARVSRVRATIMAVLREQAYYTHEIGAALGREHHTVSTQSAKALRMAAVDPEVRYLLTALRGVGR